MNTNKTLIRSLAAVAMAATLGLYGCSSQFDSVRGSVGQTISQAQADAALANVRCYSPPFDPRPYACETPGYQ